MVMGIAPATRAKKEPWAGAATVNIPVAQLHKWRGNPRQYLKRIRELGESMRAEGQLDPLVVRRSNEHPGEYDIANGLRRHAAAQLVGISELRCEIRDLTDREMIDVALATNGDREDFHPLEEAEAFRRLHVDHGVTVAEIAARHKVSEAVVRGRMQLGSLIPMVREAFEKERMTTGAALQLARLAPTVQQKAFETIWRPQTAVQIGEQEVRGYLKRTIFLPIAEAPFPRKDKGLVPSAGACEECPKRTSNQRNLFESPDEEADECTDPGCWYTKREAQIARLRARHQEIPKGKLFLPGRAAELVHASGYVEIDKPIGLLAGPDGKARTIAKLCGEGAKTTAVLTIDPNGNPRLIVTTDQARTLLKESGHHEAARKISGPTAEQRAEQARREAQAEAAQSAKELKARVAKAMAALVAEAEVAMPKPVFWTWLAKAAIRHASHESISLVFRRREEEKGEPVGKLPSRQEIEHVLFSIANESSQRAAGLAVELLSSRAAYSGTEAEGGRELLRGACEVFGLELEKAMSGRLKKPKPVEKKPAEKKAKKAGKKPKR